MYREILKWLVGYISSEVGSGVLIDVNGDSYLLDEKNRIKVIIGQMGIVVSRYSEDGELLTELCIGWQYFTDDQRGYILGLPGVTPAHVFVELSDILSSLT